MTEDKKQLNKQVSDIISDLENLDTAEIFQSESSIKDYKSILENADSDPLSVIGSEIGQWKVLELLGQGGMSIVYLVEKNDDQLQKQAALKIIPNAIASKNMIERFLRERQILSDLNHNNIAQLYDAGITEKEIPWFVMELVQGKDILIYAESQKLNTDQRISLFKQVCDALTYAHSRGVVHRDIKPNNLMVNEYGIIKLLDFGIAAEEEKKSLTMTGAIIGTPGYMSPEQAKGLSDQMDKRTDVFSLGVLLYKLLKKQMPFRADSVSEISYKIIHDEPTLMGNTIATDLQAITFKCLEKQKVNRYQTVEQLTNDLNLYQNGEEVSARKITALGRLSKKVKKYPVISSILLLVLVITILSLVYGVYQSISSLKKVQLAEKYTAKSQEIKANIWRTHMLPVHDPNEEYEQYNKQIKELKKQIESDNAAASGQANFALGKAYQAMSESTLAHENFIIARDKGWSTIELYSALGGTFSYNWQTALSKSKTIKDPKEKQSFIDQATIESYTPAMHYLKLASKDMSTPYQLLAYIAYNDKDYDKAIEYANKEFEKNPWNFVVLNIASQIHLFKFQQQSSEKGYDTATQELIKSNHYLEQAIEIGRSYPRNYTSRCSNAGVEIQLKRFFDFGREMESIFTTGMQYCKQALIMLPDAYSPWTNMSTLYTNYARYLEKNIDIHGEEKIIEIYQQSLKNTDEGLLKHPNNETMLRNKVQPFLSLAKYNENDYIAAKIYFDKAINAAMTTAKANDKSVEANISLGLAHATFANYLSKIETQGDKENLFSLSEKNYLSAIDAFKVATKNGKDLTSQFNLAGVYYRYAELKIKHKQFSDAIELLKSAFAIREKHIPMRASMFAHIKNHLITAYDLIALVQEKPIDYKGISGKTIAFINSVCELDDLKDVDKVFIAEAISESITNKWAIKSDYHNCQLN